LASRGQPFFDAQGRALRIAGVSTDITDQRRAERMRSALVDLSDVFRDTEEPDDISFAAAAIIGRTLDVSRAGYGEVDTRAETITIARDWNAPGVKTLAGVLQFRDYG
ncbi:histidine kinase, partial [Salmonella enterica subsp. enterica serovar Enteritidis]|nr:histidine kinase [Salmonella enterica subsp. enterica serovar Enteritidis]